MSFSTRLDKLEAAMRGRDGRDPPDLPSKCRRLIYDPCGVYRGIGSMPSRPPCVGPNPERLRLAVQ